MSRHVIAMRLAAQERPCRNYTSATLIRINLLTKSKGKLAMNKSKAKKKRHAKMMMQWQMCCFYVDVLTNTEKETATLSAVGENPAGPRLCRC